MGGRNAEGVGCELSNLERCMAIEVPVVAGGGGIVIRIVRPEVPAPSLALRWENDETSGDGSGEVGDGTEAGEVGMDAVSDDDDVVT